MKTKTRIVKVLVPEPVPPAGGRVAAYRVYARGNTRFPARHLVDQTITPATSQALGRDRHGYFEAEFTGHVWHIGKRVPNPDIPW